MKKIITLIITLTLLTACAGTQQQITSNTIPTPPKEQQHYIKYAGADHVLPPAKPGAKEYVGAAVIAGSVILNIVGTVLTVTGDVVTGHPVAAVLDTISGLDAL